MKHYITSLLVFAFLFLIHLFQPQATYAFNSYTCAWNESNNTCYVSLQDCDSGKTPGNQCANRQDSKEHCEAGAIGAYQCVVDTSNCGSTGQACCDNVAAPCPNGSGLTCNPSTDRCVVSNNTNCGSAGQMCCANRQCDNNMVCGTNQRCIGGCGDVGEACCTTGNACSNSATCPTSGVCQSSNTGSTGSGDGGSTSAQGDCSEESIDTAIGCIPISDSNALFGFFLKWGLGIVGGVAMLLIIIASFQVITSGGDMKKLQAGKELLTAAISGVVLLIFSVFILRILAGQDILNIPFFQ